MWNRLYATCQKLIVSRHQSQATNVSIIPKIKNFERFSRSSSAVVEFLVVSVKAS